MLGDRLPPRSRAALESFRYGDAAAKVDFVLDGPVPWAVPEVGRAGTVHVGGTRAEMARAEDAVARGEHAELPMTLVSDPTVVDGSREVHGRRPLWTYAHVPTGSDVDVTEAVTRHIERYAPGFRDVVVTSRCTPAAHLSDHNENYVGGDISAGAASIRQLFARPTAPARPVLLRPRRGLPVLGVDPARARRARAGRLVRREAGAARVRHHADAEPGRRLAGSSRHFAANRAVPRVASTRAIATSAPVSAAAATISARPGVARVVGLRRLVPGLGLPRLVEHLLHDEGGRQRGAGADELGDDGLRLLVVHE